MLRINVIWLRTLIRMFGFAGFVALFGLATLLGCAGNVRAHEPAPSAIQEEPKKEEAKQPELPPEIVETFKTPLSAEGVVETKWTGTPLKVVILRVPFDDNWSDDPLECLGAEARTQALAFENVLEQQIDYRPWLWRFDHPRVKRFAARLRFADLNNFVEKSGLAVSALDTASRCFSADVVIALSYRKVETNLECAAWTFNRQKPIAFRTVLGPLPPMSDGAEAIKSLSGSAVSILIGLASKDEQDKLGAVPALAANDAALGHFIAMRQAFEKGDLDGAWIEYSACLKADPKCGRAALYGMEIFRNHPSQLSPHRALQEGIKGALATPNDVLLRGRLAYNAAIWFKQKQWALAALETALKAQPRRYELLAWKAIILNDNDQPSVKAWMIEHMLPVCKDGRVEIAIGNTEALSDNMSGAIEWYEKAIKIAPDDHEANFSLAIISTHHAEKLQRTAFIDSTGDEQRERAIKHFNRAVWAWNRCLEIDITEQDMVLEFYVRAATRDYKYIPSDDDEMTRLFLIQAVRNGLVKGAGGVNFGRLAGNMLEIQQKLMREIVREAKPKDADYELKLIARLNFAVADKDDNDAVFVLREMRKRGYRGPAYIGFIQRYQAQVDEADAKEKKDK